MEKEQKWLPQIACEALQQQDVFMEGFNYPVTVQYNLNSHMIFWHSLQKYTGLTLSWNPVQ